MRSGAGRGFARSRRDHARIGRTLDHLRTDHRAPACIGAVRGPQCLDAWLDGRGAVGLLNLMEDAAAAEIARAKVLTLPGYERLP